MKALVIVLCVLLSGCAALDERVSTYEQRHPCGNVWDICPGDSVIIDWLHRI